MNFKKLKSYFADKGKNNISKVGLNNMYNGIMRKLYGRTFAEFEFSQVKANNSFDLTKAASAMLRHVGLYGYTPVILHERLDEKTAGYINMNSDMTFFVTIDLAKFNLAEQRLCILSHEICHKFMYVNQFRDTGMKNEYLTDACAVYVGFGKKMLEGCQTVRVTYQDNKKITQIRNIGYLEKWQISYLYYKKNPLNFTQKFNKTRKQIWESSIEFITKSEFGIYIFIALVICLIAPIVAFFIDGLETAIITFCVVLVLLITGWARSITMD